MSELLARLAADAPLVFGTGYIFGYVVGLHTGMYWRHRR